MAKEPENSGGKEGEGRQAEGAERKGNDEDDGESYVAGSAEKAS